MKFWTQNFLSKKLLQKLILKLGNIWSDVISRIVILFFSFGYRARKNNLNTNGIVDGIHAKTSISWVICFHAFWVGRILGLSELALWLALSARERHNRTTLFSIFALKSHFVFHFSFTGNTISLIRGTWANLPVFRASFRKATERQVPYHLAGFPYAWVHLRWAHLSLMPQY